MADDFVRVVDIKYTSSGADKAAADNKKVSDSFEGVMVSSDKASKASLSVERSYDGLQKKYDLVYRATQAQTVEQTKLDNARKQGLVSDDRYAYLQGQITRAYNDTVSGAASASKATAGFTQTTGLARHELINLSRQAQDVAVSLGSGQSFGTVLLQQGTQIGDVFASSGGTVKGFFSQVVSGAASIITPMRLVAGGALAIGAGAVYAAYSWSSAQKEIEQALLGVGRRSGTTVGDINRFASANASITGLSIDQARSAAIEFAKTGNIAVGGLKGVGDAIHGFSILSGKEASESAKFLAGALGGDLVKAAEKLDETYGFLNSSTREHIRTLELQGNRTAAIQVILDGIAPTNQRAAESVGILTQRWETFANVLVRVKNSVVNPVVPPDQPEAKTPPTPQQAYPGGYLNTAAAFRPSPQDIKASQEAADKFKADSLVLQLNQISKAGDDVVRSIIPEIGQIENLEKAIKAIRDAQNTPGVSRALGADDAALTAEENHLKIVRESKEESTRYNDNVKHIAASYGDVSTKTALTLNHLHNQMAVAQAVTAQAKIQAQEQATINDLLAQGKTLTEATTIAAGQRALAEAAAQASMEKQVQSSRDNLDLLKASGTADEGRLRSAIAYRNAIDAGANAGQAAAIAANTLASESIRAARAADQMADSYQRAANASLEASRGVNPSQNGEIGGQAFGKTSPYGNIVGGQTYTSTVPYGTSVVNRGGGVGKVLDVGSPYLVQLSAAGQAAIAAKGTAEYWSQQTNNILAKGGNLDAAIANIQNFRGNANTFDAQSSNLNALYGLKNSETTDKSVQLANDQQFMAWLQTQPGTITARQEMARLASEMQQLTQATVDSTQAITTLPDVLSSLYKSGQVKGFGFADGGIMTSAGALPLRKYADGGVISSPQQFQVGENYKPEAIIPLKNGGVPVHLMGGIPISIRVSNDNAKSSQPIYIHAPITIVAQGGGSDGGLQQAAAQAAQDFQGMLQGFARR